MALRSIGSLVAGLGDLPLFVFRPASVKRAVGYFRDNFGAKLLYAVKTNPERHIVEGLYKEGITAFEIASLGELEGLRRVLPKAEAWFMHPVKARSAIGRAYYEYGVRHFCLDSEAELEKILVETGYAEDLKLHLRVGVHNESAALPFGDKFGIGLEMAPALLGKMAGFSEGLGVSFHVGSQAMSERAYKNAIGACGEMLGRAKVGVRFFNIGGGFPCHYADMRPPPLLRYFRAIEESFAKLDNAENMQLVAEPGRALVAESSSLIVRVMLRKGDGLYLNDGTYGALFDAGRPHFIFPSRLLRESNAAAAPFRFYGPSCCALDVMEGPFMLPSDIGEGDYIEIGQMGAYAQTMITGFNGFAPCKESVHVSDAPIMSMYETVRKNRKTIAA